MKKLCFLFVAVVMTLSAMAQVTTSSISGTVKDAKGEAIVGATVVAVHTPSGTQYGGVVDKKGNFRIVNMRPGGPYTVKAQMLGYQGVEKTGVELALADNFVLNFKLAEETVGMEAVVVSGVTSGSIMNSDRTGASTNISSRNIATLPTISRSITDFTRLTPQAGASNSFAGRDGRYNNIMIDGSAFNNRFGLTTNNMPGGDAQPVSLDAIQEVTVNVSPFDIRESSFTGASINAVTKSGTNNYSGSAYSFIRPKQFTGDRIGDYLIPNGKTRMRQTYGLTFGGPIVKDKLFFFVNGELDYQSYPGIAWKPSEDGVGDASQYISRTTIADLQRVKDYVMEKYGYDPGSYDNFGNFHSDNYKIMARVDWNINQSNKLTVRYNQVVSKNDQSVNNNSCPSGLTRGSNRYSVDAFTFSNSNYGFENSVYSLAAELNSQFSSRVSNKFLATYTSVRDIRTSNSDLFPFIDIWEGGKQYMTLGYELFSYNNDVQNKALVITDNVTVALGNHTLVAGASFERQYVKNAYQRCPLSYYRYNSVEDFLNSHVSDPTDPKYSAPAGFGICYAYDGKDAPGVELTFGMLSAYVQDEWKVNDKLKLTGGIRFELPFYFNDISDASQTTIVGEGMVSDIEFDGGRKVDMGKWPNTQVLVSPRVGFNWDVKGDRSIQLRGGTGLFTGMLPFVWFTNQPNGAGFLQSPELSFRQDALPSGFHFMPNYKDQIAANPDMFPNNKCQVAKGGAFAVVDKKFKMPQVWRTNIAADFQLPYDLIFTVEGIFTKDVNAVVQQNINLRSETDGNFTGADNRPYWTSPKVNASVGSMMLLTNSSKGYQASITAQLTKKFSHNWSGMVAYTYNVAKDMSANPGSTAASVWSSSDAVNNLNYPGLGYSAFSVPHRVNGYLTYSADWFRCKALATTFSLYYSGSHQGRWSYTYSNDMNGDGNASDLIYIPRDKSEIVLIDNGSYTADQQWEDLDNFISGNKYLNKNRGKYAERYGALQSWLNRWDFKFVQDIKANIGADRRGKLSISLDILNLGNLLYSKWGAYNTYGMASYSRLRPLTYMTRSGSDGSITWTEKVNGVNTTITGKINGQATSVAAGTPVYRLNAKNHDAFVSTSTETTTKTTSSTWGMQLGIRLAF